MNITLSDIKKNTVIILPIVPPDVEVSTSSNNQAFETINGNINLIGFENLEQISFSSFYPKNEQEYQKNGSNNDIQGFINFILLNKKRKTPIRFVYTYPDKRTLINNLFSIDSFDFKLDKIGDLVYSLKLTRFME